MHKDTAVEHMGCCGCGCGGFWQTNGEVMRKREEVETSHHKKEDAGTGARIWGERELTGSHSSCGIWLSQITKKCVYPSMLPIQ